MISDLSIAGWMLSVVPEIRKDAIDNATGPDWLCVEHVIEKLFHGETPQVLGQKKVTFWIELDGFQNKIGYGFDRPHIWNSVHITNGESHFWHKHNSLPYTEVLGFVACHVTSKILGIGGAERSWGNVKQLKSGKQSYLKSQCNRKAVHNLWHSQHGEGQANEGSSYFIKNGRYSLGR